MVDPASLHCPVSWSGGFVGNYCNKETPKAVLIIYVADCNNFVIVNTSSLLRPTICNVNKATQTTILS